MNDRRGLILLTLIALILMPAIVLYAFPGEEDDHFAYLPLIRTSPGDPVLTWAMAYGYEVGIRHDMEAVVESSDGGFVYGGRWFDTDTTGDPCDIFITKVGLHGGIVWQKRFSGRHCDLFADLDRTVDGKLIVAGGAIGETTKSRDIWFAKLGEDGSIIWQRLFTAGATLLDGHDIQPTADGGFIAVGSADSGNGGLWMVKVDGDGDLQWQKQYTDMYASSAAVVEDGNGGYFVSGTWDHPSLRGLDIHVQQLDGDGEIIWQKAFGERLHDDWFMALERASDGGMFVAGLYIGDSWSDLHFWLMKLKEDGSVQWRKELIGDWDMINVIRATPDGGCLVGGNTSDGDMWLLKMKANGTAAWQRLYQGSEWDEPRDLRLVSSGGYLLAGWTRSYGSGDANAWLLKTDGQGRITGCSIDEAGSPVLQEFSLLASTPAITDVSLDWTISAGDLASSNDEITRTVVCEPTMDSASNQCLAVDEGD